MPTYTADLEEIEDAALQSDTDDSRYDTEDNPGCYRTLRCKKCHATTRVDAWPWSDPASELQSRGWTYTLRDGRLVGTTCPICANPPPPVPTSAIQSLLESIETSVENRAQRRLSALSDRRDALVESFRKYDPHRLAKDYIDDLAACSTQYTLFSVDGELAVHPIRCRKRACPICESLKMKKWYHRMTGFTALFSAPKHITLTVKSTDEALDAQLQRLTRSFRRLRQRKLWKERCPWGVWTIEVTRNAETGLWHPHIHVIVNTAFIPVAQLRSAWKKITGDSHQVHIRAVDSNIAGYLCRYIAKTSSIYSAPVDPFQTNAMIKGKRLVQPFGRWPKIPQPPKTPVKFIGTVADIVFQARGGDPRARAYCSIIRSRWPQALLAACTLPRPPDLPAHLPPRSPVTRSADGTFRPYSTARV